ncbi:MAG: hypothetical protein J5856_06025 [Lachnospiraceae bacterium]|nr:hypothetical protein [Lachnospiraceae bacterium]
MKNDNTKKISEKIFLIVSALCFAFYSFTLVRLHIRQIGYPETGLYESDLYAHIQMALNGWGYSLMAIVIRLLSKLPEFAFTFAVASLLCFFEAGAAALTFLILKQYKTETKLAIVFTACATFAMPFYIRAIQPYRYIGYQSGTIWHNSTYIAMKFFAIIVIMLFLLISENYRERLSAGSVIAFAVLLSLTTAVKTNFVLIFAPAALLFLIADAILGAPLKRIFFCALTVIPSIAVILFQKFVLFGEGTGNKIIIDPLYGVYLRAEKPYFTMILSAAFPIAVFLYNIIPVLKDTVKDFREKKRGLTHRFFLLSWTMWFVGFVQLILLREVGERQLDDNFAWGYDFCLFVLFVVSIIYFARNASSLLNIGICDMSDKTDISDNKKVKFKGAGIAYSIAALAILLYQVYCGVFFYIRLSQGLSFFMQ